MLPKLLTQIRHKEPWVAVEELYHQYGNDALNVVLEREAINRWGGLEKRADALWDVFDAMIIADALSGKLTRESEAVQVAVIRILFRYPSSNIPEIRAILMSDTDFAHLHRSPGRVLTATDNRTVNQSKERV